MIPFRGNCLSIYWAHKRMVLIYGLVVDHITELKLIKAEL